MKNLESIEALWRQQTIVVSGDARKIRSLQTSVGRVVASRGRLLKWGVAITLFSLFAGQLLTVVNYVQAGRIPTLPGLVHLGVLQALQLGFLIGLLRRIRAHRQLRAKSAEDVRENVRASLAMIDGEMRDYRIGARLFGFLLLFDTIPVLNNYQQGYFDGAGAAGRLSFILLLGLFFIGLARRHYRRVLQPRREQLAEVLGELDAP
jgi:hypothetical protein